MANIIRRATSGVVLGAGGNLAFPVRVGGADGAARSRPGSR